MKKKKSDIKTGVKNAWFPPLDKRNCSTSEFKTKQKYFNNWTEDINEKQLSKNLVLVLGYANSNEEEDEAIPFCCFYCYQLSVFQPTPCLSVWY